MRHAIRVITGVVGPVLVVFGVLVFLFIAYQLWGTTYFESHSQDQLRQRFDALLHESRDHHSGSTPSTSTTTNTTTPNTTAPNTTTTTTAAPTVAAPTAPPSEGSPVGLIEIPKIQLDKVIVQGTGTPDLQEGPGHFPGTPLPGEKGNAAIAGHRTTYGAPFFNLNELAPGDPIIITTVQGTFTYHVMRTLVVSPNNTSVAGPSQITAVAPGSGAMLTLTTCNPRFSASTRLVVQAALVTPPAPTPTPVATTTVKPGRKPNARRSTTSNLGGEQGSWPPALWWGLAVLFSTLAGWRASTRVATRSARWVVYGVSGVAGLVLLFFFFGAVSPLLPASF
jgi:sortase A